MPQKLYSNYLTHNMQNYLNKQEAVFDFMVQFYVDESITPINDASKIWDEKDSPFIKIGEIRIPMQNFTTNERFEISEKMSFSPGNSIIEHSPVGDINIGRTKIYDEMNKSRHYRNSQKLYEPTSKDFKLLK